jgi:very-short-patch-repair endonuclease
MKRSLSQDMARFGNLALRSQLKDLGYTHRDIRRAVDAQELWPIRRLWLAHRGADARAARAVALGGRLAAESALATYGIWVTRATGLWIGTPQGRGRLPSALPGEHRLWVREQHPTTDGKLWRMSVSDSLTQYARLASFVDTVAAFDSALHQRLLTRAGLDDIVSGLPRRYRRLATRVDGRADSGLETLIRLAAQMEGWRVEIQVKIAGVGRVDILIDGWLVIELDGGEWHDDAASQDEDRRRDAQLTLLGYRWQRFRSRQVLGDLEGCLQVIRTILASGRPAGVGQTDRLALR